MRHGTTLHPHRAAAAAAAVVVDLYARHRLATVGRLTALLLAGFERPVQQQVVSRHLRALLVGGRRRRLSRLHLLHRSFYHTHTRAHTRTHNLHRPTVEYIRRYGLDVVK